MNMGKRDISSREIDLLLALAIEPSFTAAAASLDLTQSAVSRAVKQVEHKLGKELLVRSKSGSAPTRQLAALLPRLRAARKALDAITAYPSSESDEVKGTIRVAGFRSAISILLPKPVSTFMARHRRVRISLSTLREVKGGVQEAVLSRKADFGITTVRPGRGLRSVHLGADNYVVIRRAGAKSRRVAKRECLILWDERCSECIPEILERNHWSPIETMCIDSDVGVIAMVEEGAGFAILPELATEPLSPRLERLELPVGWKRDIWMCAHPDAWDSPTGKAFRRIVVNDVSARLSMSSAKRSSAK